MKKGDRVRLIKFENASSDEEDISSECYHKLIGEEGTVQQDPHEKSLYASFSEEPRILVKFDKDLESSLGLIAHNNIENSLWMLVSELEIIRD